MLFGSPANARATLSELQGICWETRFGKLDENKLIDKILATGMLETSHCIKIRNCADATNNRELKFVTFSSFIPLLKYYLSSFVV